MGTRTRAATQTPEPRPTIKDHFPFRHSLDTGDRGILVMWAQSRLMANSHYEGPLDGRYDREVTLAVRKYQSDNGLKITGVIDRKTWDALASNDEDMA